MKKLYFITLIIYTFILCYILPVIINIYISLNKNIMILNIIIIFFGCIIFDYKILKKYFSINHPEKIMIFLFSPIFLLLISKNMFQYNKFFAGNLGIVKYILNTVYVLILFLHIIIFSFYSKINKKYLLFILCFGYFLLFPLTYIHGLHGDEINYVWLSQSIKQDFDLNLYNNVPRKQAFLIDHYYYKTPEKVYSVKLPGISIISLPLYIVLKNIGIYITIIFFTIISMFYLYKLNNYYIKNKKTSFYITLLFSFTHPILFYSCQIYPEIFAVFSIILFLYFLKSKSNFFILPFLSGILLWFHIKYIAISILFFILISKKKAQKILYFSLIFFVFLTSIILYSYNIYNSLNPFAGFMKGGDTVYNNSKDLFLEKIIKNNIFFKIYQNFFSMKYGLFLHNPIYIIAIISLLYFCLKNFKKYKEISILFFGYIFYICLNKQGYNGFSPFNRLILPVLPLLAIPLSDFINKFYKNKIFKTLFLIIIFISLFITLSYTIIPFIRFPNVTNQNNFIILLKRLKIIF